MNIVEDNMRKIERRTAKFDQYEKEGRKEKIKETLKMKKELDKWHEINNRRPEDK